MNMNTTYRGSSNDSNSSTNNNNNSGKLTLVARLVLALAVLCAVLAATAGDAFGFSSKVIDPNSARAFAPSKAIPIVYNAYQSYLKNFPSFLSSDREVFVVQARNENETVFTDLELTKRICLSLESELESGVDEDAIREIASYFTYSDSKFLKGLASNYVSVDNKTMLVVVELSNENADQVNDIVSKASSIAEKWNGYSTSYKVEFTGRLATAAEVSKSTGKGFALSDGIGLPFIVVLFYFQVPSFRLLLIPALALGVSLITCYALGGLLSDTLDIPSFQPNIMLFLCLAFSIDYSFFMLTRFQEERFKYGRNIADAVRVMIRDRKSVV